MYLAIISRFKYRCVAGRILEVGEIRANCSGKKGPDHKRHWCERDGMLSHPAAGLVVVEVHKLAGAVQSPGNFIGFSLADVDKVLSKSALSGIRGGSSGADLLVSVLNIVSTSSPDPGRLQVLGPVGSTAPTAGQLAVPAAPGHAVHHPGAGHGVGEGRLLRCCK